MSGWEDGGGLVLGKLRRMHLNHIRFSKGRDRSSFGQLEAYFHITQPYFMHYHIISKWDGMYLLAGFFSFHFFFLLSCRPSAHAACVRVISLAFHVAKKQKKPSQRNDTKRKSILKSPRAVSGAEIQ